MLTDSVILKTAKAQIAILKDDLTLLDAAIIGLPDFQIYNAEDQFSILRKLLKTASLRDDLSNIGTLFTAVETGFGITYPISTFAIKVVDHYSKYKVASQSVETCEALYQLSIFTTVPYELRSDYLITLITLILENPNINESHIGILDELIALLQE